MGDQYSKSQSFTTACPVCRRNDSQIKRLSCSHNICIRCTRKFIIQTGNDEDDDESIVCPECKEYTTVPDGMVQRLLENKLYERIVKVFREYNGEEPCSKCGEENIFENLQTCVTCDIELCVTCCVKHKHSKESKCHVIEKRGGKHLYCKKHRAKCVKFCLKCETFMCENCITEEDNNAHEHEIENLDEIRETFKDEIVNIQTEELKEDDVKDVIARIDNQLEKGYRMKDVISDYAYELDVKIIKKRYGEALKQEVEKMNNKLLVSNALFKRKKELLDKIEAKEKELNAIKAKIIIINENKEVLGELKETTNDVLEADVEYIIIAACYIKNVYGKASDIVKFEEEDVIFEPQESLVIGNVHFMKK